MYVKSFMPKWGTCLKHNIILPLHIKLDEQDKIINCSFHQKWPGIFNLDNQNSSIHLHH